MILTELVLENFGVYRGRNRFDLRPRIKYGHTRPIVLFGGKNGAGKTTVLEALYLCLYGELHTGSLGTAQVRSKYLKARIHRAPNALLQSTSAALELEFEHTHAGERNIYRIVRSWVDTGRSVNESLQVTRDGLELDEVASDQWQDFIKDLMPPGLASLCFFDGERIQELAQDSSSEESLRRSILGLLGLEVVDRLDTDLKLFSSRVRRDAGVGKQAAELNALEDALSRLRDELAILRQDTAQSQGLLENAVSRQAGCEDSLRAQGGEYANRRATNQDRSHGLTAEFEEAERQSRELCGGVLPFTLAPELCSGLLKTVAAEVKLESGLAASGIIRACLKQLRKKAASSRKPKDFPRGDGVEETIDYVESEILSSLPDTSGQVVHGLADAERIALKGWLDEAGGQVIQKAKKLGRKLESLVREQAELERKLAAAPEDDELVSFHDKLVAASELVGRRNAELAGKQESVRRLELRFAETTREIGKLEKSVQTTETSALRLARAERAQQALQVFRKRLIDRKVEELERSFSVAYRHLSRKEDLIREIHLNPETLTATLEDRHGRIVSRQELSAGEKQIYAISMLWALAKCSGRPLPLVIDTPLGRLDTDHRDNLVKDYFPEASHQVIILSTDAEIDQSFYEDLRLHLSHAYRLEFNTVEEKTEFEEGYFWRHQSAESEFRRAAQ